MIKKNSLLFCLNKLKNIIFNATCEFRHQIYIAFTQENYNTDIIGLGFKMLKYKTNFLYGFNTEHNSVSLLAVSWWFCLVFNIGCLVT